MDLYITDPPEGQFIRELRESLSYEHVIGMMFWGGTKKYRKSGSWIINFNNRNYTMISVILRLFADANSTGRRPLSQS